MEIYYVFNDYGTLQFTTTNESYASSWCDQNDGYYCCDEEDYDDYDFEY